MRTYHLPSPVLGTVGSTEMYKVQALLSRNLMSQAGLQSLHIALKAASNMKKKPFTIASLSKA